MNRPHRVSKRSAALLSFAFSLLLAAIKVVVGVMSGSLSIIAEAIDSVIDLVSDGVTFLAVRVADLPPDDNHPYGHARAENLGALAQTVLLVATALWILWEALDRIFFHPTMPEVSLWVFLIIVASVLINVVRVYRLNQVATRLKSQALSASVANFTNDILRSLVVLAVLGLIMLDSVVPLPSWLLVRFDPVAAAVVALIALGMAWNLGQQAISALMDSIPDELNHRLTSRVSELPSVVPNSTHVRTRFVGEQPFVEVTVGMPRGHSLEEAHELTHRIEHAVRAELKEASVLVHVEPTRTDAEPYTTAVYSAAHRLGLRVHHLDIYQLKEEVRVDMDLELPGSLSLERAHTFSERLEEAIAAELPCQVTIAVHLEPRRDQVQPAVHYEPVHEQVHQTLETLPYVSSIVKAETLLTDEGVVVTLHCQFPGETLLTEVHTTMAHMERELRRVMPDIVRVRIDPEPQAFP